jgi:colanic acid/amylovoran biosynthesis protein
MIIEIRGAGFVNKGAELMLLAILAKMASKYPEARFTMVPTGRNTSQPFERLTRAGIYPKASLQRGAMELGRLGSALPRRLRERYGLVLDQEVDVVIDAAGFAYTDQWGPGCTSELARSASRWHRQGTKLILLPQAFGPFSSARIRRDIKTAVSNSALVMPREHISARHLSDVVGSRENIRVFPDFTNLLHAEVPANFDDGAHRVCLVPNWRMIDKTTSDEAAAYLRFMIHCARTLAHRDMKPFLLVHEGEDDVRLAEQIAASAGGLPILREDSALGIKGILGACYATIGSRFHGLVSALSQGVPSLATAWSHKYGELFADYGFPSGVISVTASTSDWDDAIDQIIDRRSNDQLRERLKVESMKLKLRSEEMWETVFCELQS